MGFVLVGDWWCPLLGGSPNTYCSHPKSYKCSKEYSHSCLTEASDFLGTLNLLVANDYGASSPYLQQLSLWYCQAEDCGGQGLQLRLYEGQQFFYGPVAPGAATSGTVGGTLNSVAGNFGIASQSDASDTVFYYGEYPYWNFTRDSYRNGSGRLRSVLL